MIEQYRATGNPLPGSHQWPTQAPRGGIAWSLCYFWIRTKDALSVAYCTPRTGLADGGAQAAFLARHPETAQAQISTRKELQTLQLLTSPKSKLRQPESRSVPSARTRNEVR